MDIDLLVNLSARAWSLKILASLAAGVPGRQAPLLAATGASRTAFAASLEHLVRLGLLERNPGHGHPLRPEYRLTATGAAIAPMAERLLATVDDTSDAKLLRRAWTVPILAVTGTPKRFNEIKTGLSRISDRALSQSLQQLEERAWLRRDVDIAQRPVRPTYQAVALGAQISRTLGPVSLQPR